MKTNHLIPLVLALGLAAFPVTGCAENAADKTKAAENAAPADKAEPGKEAPPAAAEIPDAAFVRWSDIKGYTYDQRDLFLTGLKGLEARVDALVSELANKRAAMSASNTSTKAWDLAMQEMSSARTNFMSTSNDMGGASREVWDQQKDKVGLAWVRTQDAYAKVKASTTN